MFSQLRLFISTKRKPLKAENIAIYFTFSILISVFHNKEISSTEMSVAPCDGPTCATVNGRPTSSEGAPQPHVVTMASITGADITRANDGRDARPT